MKNIKEEEVLTLKQKVSQRFAELRSDLNCSQAEMAETIGTTQNLIYRVENGVKVSSDALFHIILWWISNYNLNTEWLMSPDNEELVKYHTSGEKLKRKRTFIDEKKQQIIDKMMAEMQKIEMKKTE